MRRLKHLLIPAPCPLSKRNRCSLMVKPLKKIQVLKIKQIKINCNSITEIRSVNFFFSVNIFYSPFTMYHLVLYSLVYIL